MHLVVHAPFGSRLNRAFGTGASQMFLSQIQLRVAGGGHRGTRLSCRLGPPTAFPLRTCGLFSNRSQSAVSWCRRCWTRRYLPPGFAGTPRVPCPCCDFVEVRRWRRRSRECRPRICLTVVFPDQVACLENVVGDREIPDHPLVETTVRDCTEEATDVDGLVQLIQRIEGRELTLLTRDLTEPSPLAAEILNARPYAFLDDAPLEERRTQAIQSRRWLDPATASDLGALDVAAIERVRAEAFPDPSNADELHDALVLHGYLTADEGNRSDLGALLSELMTAGRAALVQVGDQELWVSAERSGEIRAVHPEAVFSPPVRAPKPWCERDWTREVALVELVRGRLEGAGPDDGC